jgi:AraC-like DNA-binding protein
MDVFHGSYTKIEQIDLQKAQPNKDFGQGFYVTKFRHHAESWAKIIGRKHHTEGVVTPFIYYDSPFTERLCKVKHFNAYNEEWLDFVVTNRNPLAATHDYDIVEGPVANDKVQTRIFDYLKGNIHKADFLKELEYHEETHQICFCTLKSLLTLEHIDQNKISNIIHLSEPLVERLMADFDLNEMEATDRWYNSATFAQLSNDTTGLCLENWQKIYELLKAERL